MIRPVLTYGAPGLRTRAVTVTCFDEELKNLAQDMLETMYAASGVGLAAPQIGVSSRLIAIDPFSGEEKGHQFVFVNPVISKKEGSEKNEEGCLSIPGFTAVVERPICVHVTGQDLKGNPQKLEAEGLLARIFCHEIDHLDGVLYIDLISAVKKDFILKKIHKLVRAGEW